MFRRLRYWLESNKRNSSLREEMELHLAERAEELEASGMAADRARSEARRRFGNFALKHEEAREIWITRFLSELSQDLRYGWRTLAANKSFSALAILSLALGIGANTAIYSFMESILLRSLPVSEPESLVVWNWTSPSPQNADKDWVHVVHGVQGILWPGGKGKLVSGMFPYPAFEEFRKDNPAFSTVFGYFDGHTRSFSVNGQAMSATMEYVTGDYFLGLSIAPAAGRLLHSGDDRPGVPAVAVISHATSQQRFGGPTQAIGQSVLIDRIPFTVVGVTPPDFFGVDPAASPDLYLPLHTNLLLDTNEAARGYSDANFYWIEMMGRLRPGVTMAQAQALLAPRFHQWVDSTATTDGERKKLPTLLLNPGAAGLGSLRREYSKPLYVLLAMVSMILAITCANIANLLLARAAARRREMAVRLSLGAGRFRVVRQLLTESVMLASLGGALGLVFAIWGIRTLTYLFSKGRETFTLHAELNWLVLAATAALVLLCGLVFGLAPAIQATRPDVLPALKGGQGSAPRNRLQNALVLAQIAMSFLILFAAGLFVQTLNNLNSVELGYARDNVLLFNWNARQAGHQGPELTRLYADLRKRLESIPGVASVTFSQSSILNSGHVQAIEGPMKLGLRTLDDARAIAAGPAFLTTMQIPILSGREIDDRDQAGSRPVCVISEQLARTYFGNENPLGRRISLPQEKRELEIVGVSANLRNGGLKIGTTSMTVFVALSQISADRVTYALRTTGDPLSVVSSVREIARAADPAIPVTNLLTQTAEMNRSINRELLFAKLCTGFAVLALLTACVGLYGTMSYSVARQVSEIGIRMALGAQRGTVVWMVLRRAVILAAAGLAISLPAALGLSRLIKSLLFGTQPNDPRTLALAAAILIGTAILAGIVPARRASRIDPLVALRRE